MRMQVPLPPTFEIKIAVLGYVSAGKTTVINALLRDKYGEVSMRRTTAGINHFRLSSRNKQDGQKAESTNTEALPTNSDEESTDWTVTEEYRSAESTLGEITTDNATFRESSDIHVKSFDIELDEQLCQMREDTKLVLVDIPGINEAGAGGKYRAYVTEKWDTFDCAIVVMDGRQGANTEEQVSLLEYVKKNNEEKKDIPVIILCNKIDDPEDDERVLLVQEVREEVERIFKTSDRQDALNAILTGKQPPVSTEENQMFPAFIATSAVFAYIYRTASLMTFEEFAKFDKDMIRKLGRKELGELWSLGSEEMLQLVYKAVSDPSIYGKRLEATNFDKVLKVLSCAVGGKDVQLQLIQKQIGVALQSLYSGKDITAQLRAICERRQGLGQPTDDIKEAFWETFEECENSAFSLFSADPLEVDSLVLPLKELFDYYNFATSQEWKDEQKLTLKRIETFVRRQLAFILVEGSQAKPAQVFRKACYPVEWTSLHPIDWKGICRSVLLLSHDKRFYENFGSEKLDLEDLADKFGNSVKVADFGKCPTCHHTNLDFNHFCAKCHTFFVEDGPQNWSDIFKPSCYKFPCCNREHTTSGYGRCPRCGQNGHAIACHLFKFASSSIKDPLSGSIFCPDCSEPLNMNRRCNECDCFFYLRGCNQERKFICCEDASARCKKMVWKELPYGIDEFFSPSYDVRDGTRKPKYPKVYKSCIVLDMPQSLSDPKHFGHISWQYCEFMAKLGEESKAK